MGGTFRSHRITDKDAIVTVGMTEEICRKLAVEIEKGIATEAQAVYLLAGIRKLIERDDLSEQFGVL
jgi:hypothetical protein